MAYKSPHDGGCWYCYDDGGEIAFTTEFDAFVHVACVQAALARADPADRETPIIARDLGILPPATPPPPTDQDAP